MGYDVDVHIVHGALIPASRVEAVITRLGIDKDKNEDYNVMIPDTDYRFKSYRDSCNGDDDDGEGTGYSIVLKDVDVNALRDRSPQGMIIKSPKKEAVTEFKTWLAKTFSTEFKYTTHVQISAG